MVFKTPYCDKCGKEMKIVVRGLSSVLFECRSRSKVDVITEALMPLKIHYFLIQDSVLETSYQLCISSLEISQIMSFSRLNVLMTKVTPPVKQYQIGSVCVVRFVSTGSKISFIMKVNWKVQVSSLKSTSARLVRESTIVEGWLTAHASIYGTWILGMMEIQPDKFEEVDTVRDATKLTPLILKHFLPGTTIVMDL